MTAPGPIEHRESSVANVLFPQRIIEVIVTPYDEPAIVEYRGELWKESFDRGAWDGIETRREEKHAHANRDHDRTRIVGKAVRLEPSREEGLVAEVRVAKTDLGDETLALADEDILGASAGFAARMRDQVFDRVAMTRRVRRAFLDHIAFVGNPAYRGAAVVGVRSDGDPGEAAGLPKLVRPDLDELLSWKREHLELRQANITVPDAADLNAEARRMAASRGWAMPNGSFPIRPADNHGAEDLRKAIRAVGRGGASGNSIRRHIMKRARAIGMSDMIPDTWMSDGSLSR